MWESRAFAAAATSFALMAVLRMAAATVPSDIKVKVSLDEPSPSGAPTSDFKFSFNAGRKEKKHTGQEEKQQADEEAKQEAEDSKYISQLVANVTRIREHYESSGMPERFLREKLEALVSDQKKAADESPEEEADTTCPPPGFTSVSPFSLKDYISAPWYVQEQMLLSYQPPSTLYCVKATYIPLDPKNLTAGLQVFNYANFGGVNGLSIGGAGSGLTGFGLQATVANASMPSMLRVAPNFSGILGMTLDFLGLGFLNNVGSGAYWVVAAGPKAYREDGFKGYEWAIVSGGAPSTPSNGACKTGRGLPWPLEFSDVGYWFLTRAKVAPPELLAKMRAVGKSLGYDNSVLLPVEQKGCTYDGSRDVDK